MATVSVLNPVAEEAETRKKEAQQHWKAILQAGPLASTNSLRVGFHAAALDRKNEWGILGFADKKEAQRESGFKESTWHNVIRIAEAYPSVEEKLFIGMKLTNAEALMDLPESKRLTEYWMRKAATESIESFAKQVEEELDGKEKPSNGREKIVSISIKVPKSTKKVVEEGLREYAKAAGCEGNEAKAIELLVAEHREGVSLVGCIQGVLERISKMKELEVTGLSSDEILEKVYAGLDDIVSDFQEALESLQNLDSEAV